MFICRHLAGSQWLDSEKLGDMLREKIPERDVCKLRIFNSVTLIFVLSRIIDICSFS